MKVVLAAPLVATSLHAAELVQDDATLIAEDGSIQVLKGETTILQLDEIKVDYTLPESWKITSSDSDSITISLTFPSSVEYRREPSDTEDRSYELTVSKFQNGFRLHADPEWGNQTTLTFSDQGDAFFGLSEPLQPANRHSPNLRESSILVDVQNEAATIVENYASAFSAFYMSSFGYGAFYDTFAQGVYDFAINGKNVIHHETGTLDLYLFFGDNGSAIHQQYFDLIGDPKKVPLWGLGPIGWRDDNSGGADEILDDVKRLSELEIPFTSWFVDRPYSDGAHAWSHMNFNEKFANPEVWIKSLQDDYGLEFMTWTATAFFGDPQFEEHLPGHHTYLDISHQPSVEAFQERLKTLQHEVGVKGHKIDRGDEVFPYHEQWFDESVPLFERRNRYAYGFTKLHDEVLRETWEDDQITFARTAYHRTQPFLTAVWGGDPRTSWEGLQGNIANGIRCGFMGFPIWGTDAGGYLGDGYIPEDLYIRWLQAASANGLFEIKLDGSGGQGRDRMPWQYGEDLQDAFRQICQDRMDLLPYLNTLANRSGDTGVVMKPMAYRHLDDPKTYELWDQFYVGDALLVAPVMTPENKRRVYLPTEGLYRDYEDPSQTYEGNQEIDIDVPLTKFPRFIEPNSVFVTGHIYAGNSKLWEDKETLIRIHANPGPRSTSNTFEYLDLYDDNSVKRITVSSSRTNAAVICPLIASPLELNIYVDKRPIKVTRNGQEIDWQYHADRATVSLRLPPNQASQIDVQIEEPR